MGEGTTLQLPMWSAVDGAAGENYGGHRSSPQPPLSPERQPQAIWNGETQTFSAGVLRRAMLVRGFTPDSLAMAAGVGRGTVYNALASRPSRLTTARRLPQTLAGVEPTLRLSDLASGED